MRFREYKCPTSRCDNECIYPGMFDDEAPCLYCGKRYDETRTIFDQVRHWYWSVWSHDWRPGQVWYRFKCWAWKRHTTVKPRTLGHTWCDKTHLLPHVLFEMLCDFVETELRDGIVDWDAFEDQAAARDEMESLYQWWNETYQEDYPFCLPKEEYDAIEDVAEVEAAYQKLLLANCKRIVDLSPYMWT